MRGRRGFSLVETLIIVVLVGVLVSLVAARFSRARGAASAQGLAEAVSQEFVWARQRARSTGVPVAIVFPSQGGTKAHTQSLYVLEGQATPRITRVKRYGGDFQGSGLFVGSWSLNPSLLSDPSALNARVQPDQAIRSQSFDVSAWGAPFPQDPCFVFTPSGALVSNNQVHFDGAYHIVACAGIEYTSAAVAGSPSATPTLVGQCFTINVSLLGEVSLSNGFTASSGGIPERADLGFVSPPALPPNPVTGANQNPVISLVEVFPVPVAANLPAGVDATVDLSGYLTFHVRASDPDQDPLSIRWQCAQGTMSSPELVAMQWDGTAWDQTWEWRPPLGAPVGAVYTLNCEVVDGRGGLAVGTLGASGQVQVISGGKIAFRSDRSGQRDIFVMNPDGTEVTNLTNTPLRNESFPVWSPDGTRIAFTAPGATTMAQVWVMNADGSDEQMLTTHAFECQNLSWSPDGTRIVYSLLNPTTDLRAVNADGSNDRFLLQNPTDGWVETCWHPDGLVGLVGRNGGAVGVQEDLFLLAPDGTLGANMTALSTDDEYAAFSPDGLSVAWHTSRDGNFEIYVAGFNGSAFTGLLNLTTHGANDKEPSWSPDSQRVAFTSTRVGGGNQIFVTDLGGVTSQLTNGPGACDMPNWGRPR